MASYISFAGPTTPPMATTGWTQLDIGMSMQNVIDKSRCNQASARLTSGPGISCTYRFEHYVRSTMNDLENTISNTPRVALVQDIIAIKEVLQMIQNYGGAANDGFRVSVQPIVSVSEALLEAAREHHAIALMLDGAAAMGPSEPRSDEATASSSLSTQLLKETLANGRLNEGLVVGSGTWTDTLPDEFPQSLDDLSETSSSSGSEDSSRLSDHTAATSLLECTDHVKAQGLKASPPPALCPV